MISVRKSPNMMSTTGRMPVIAAPSPSPVIPASEIGESMTRSGPNSSTSPARTLNGVPGLGDVLADQEHASVAAQLLGERLVDRLRRSVSSRVADLGHRR